MVDPTMDGLPSLPDKAALLRRAIPHRAGWDNGRRPESIEPAGPGEESVWTYPRPPALRETDGEIEIRCADGVLAQSSRALNIVETAGAPVHYLPPEDVRTDWLVPTDHVTVCEWKGAAVHFDLVAPSETVRHAAFAYPDPFDDLDRGFSRIAGWFGFYPAKLACYLDGERVRPQPGGLYAGWVTDAIRGPVKGAPGTEGW